MGPEDYCNSIQLSIEFTPTSSQTYTVVYATFKSDQRQKGKSH